MGVVGKKLMWIALAVTNLPQPSGCEFDQLQRRRGQQIKRIKGGRTPAVQQAFAGTTGSL
jgi:hypothetical protein